MKLTAAAALMGFTAPQVYATLFPSSLSSYFRPGASKSAEYVVNESGLSTIIEEPPSFVSQTESSGLTTDIVSLGSVTRMDYLTAQIETWASHRGVRHYWGFSELQDFDPECSAMSDEARAAAVETCKASPVFKDAMIKSFFSEYYGKSEGNRVRSGDAGWICAQRRVGRALGWLHSQYSGGATDIPDYLMVVDDDTYVDLVDVMSYLEGEAKKSEDEAFARAGCVFQPNGIIPFPIAYGGFGTILNKAAVQQLSEPIFCSGIEQNEAICAQIKADKVGEASIFKDGMTVFEMFYKYSATKDFCMHSDWLLGYMFEYYLSHPQSLEEGEHNLMGMKTYPSCGNITVATGAVRPCTQFSDTCHNQNPKDMEALAISSFAQSPESYKTMPKMELTELEAAMNVVKEKGADSAKDVHIPHVLLIDSVSSDLSKFLTSNDGLCGSDEVHFFDNEDSYNLGVTHYANSFAHCSGDDLILDATPDTLMQAERVHELYNQVGFDVKVIAVVRESSPGEFGRHLDTWAHLFDRQQMLVLSSSELQKHPRKSQWRIEQFLGKSLQGELESVSAAMVPAYSAQDLKDMHEEFYNFIDNSRGPWMEERPFPRADAPRNVAYAAVLGWNPDQEQNKLYLDAMRVMIRSLKDAAADFVVLMMSKDKEAEALLSSEGAIIQHIEPMKHSLDIPHFEPWFVNIALAKLHAFELTSYDRVQVLDVDALITSADEMDALFTSFPDARLVAEGLGTDSPLRAGWLMIKPSSVDFHNMQELLERGTFSSEHGWDNLDLVVEYPGWSPAKPSNKWEFYGSQLEQGVLFHYFYALPKSVNPSVQDSDLLTLLDDESLVSHGFVHFYGSRKPWAKNVDDSSFPTHINVARKQWLANSERVSAVSAADHLSPLTEFGIRQYERALVTYTYSPTSAPVTPAPVTPAPVTPAPTTPAPSSAPVTSSPAAPITPAPTTPAPVSSAPTTPAPSSAPVTPAPVSSAPVTPAPVSSSPTTGAPTSLAPVSAVPTASPISYFTIVEIDSTLTWNITGCASLNATTLVDVAKIVEQSVYETTDPLLPIGYFQQLVYVYELCGQAVAPHMGYPNARRLQASQEEIKLYQVVSTACQGCQEEIFNNTNSALVTVANDGSLTNTIQNKSGDVIQAVISGNVSSTYNVTTNRPTSAPTNAPVSSAPVTPAPVTPAPVTPAPVTPAPVTLAPVTSSPALTPVTPAPVTPAPVTPAPVTPAPVTPAPVSSATPSADVPVPTSASPTKKPITPRPSASKSSKNTKSTPKPVTPMPTPRPTTAKSNKASKVIS